MSVFISLLSLAVLFCHNSATTKLPPATHTHAKSTTRVLFPSISLKEGQAVTCTASLSVAYTHAYTLSFSLTPHKSIKYVSPPFFAFLHHPAMPSSTASSHPSLPHLSFSRKAFLHPTSFPTVSLPSLSISPTPVAPSIPSTHKNIRGQAHSSTSIDDAPASAPPPSLPACLPSSLPLSLPPPESPPL